MNIRISPFSRPLAQLTALVAFCSLAVASAAGTDIGSFDLCSPKNHDHFQVAKPLLFWQSSVGAKHYEVFIDGNLAADVPASPLPVMSYAPSAPLSPGKHQWVVKAMAALGDDHTSGTFDFTVEPSTNWPAWAIGPFVRYGANPILQPRQPLWEHWNVYNPGVIFDHGRFLMLYRGQENIRQGGQQRTLSRIGFAQSLDGVTFCCNPVPVIDATQPYETRYGCEDARLVKYHGRYYAFYTGNLNPQSAKICLCEATSTDCIHWKQLGIIQTGTKNGAIVRDPAGRPVKLNGRFVMYTGDSSLGVCYSKNLVDWSPVEWINLDLPSGWVAPYEPCVAVADYSAAHPDNIVLFIAGTLNGKGKWFYAISEVLFFKSDLTHVAARLQDCIMKPKESYESGTFKNCIWMNSILLHDGQWWMHYGAGDRNIGLATAPLK